VYSLNVPAPGRVKRLAADLHPRLVGFERVRERHSLVVKRFAAEDYNRLYERARRALAGTPAVEARATTIDSFDDPVRGPGPVVYLAVESPGLFAIHERLVEAFGAIPDLEGPDYVPHVTLARGGSAEQVQELRALDIEPVEWTVSELVFYDAVHDERVSTVSLPLSP
jgi:2'-5' RNA ligase